MTDDLETPTEPLARAAISEAGQPKEKWILSVYADRLEFMAGDRTTHEIAFADRHEMIQLIERGLFIRRALFATLNKKRRAFVLDPDVFCKVEAWFGPLTIEDLKVSLKRRFGWALPVGIVFILSAAPLGNAPIEPIAFGLGLGLVATALLSKVVPHRLLFVFESLWFCALAANSIFQLVAGSGWCTMVMLALQLHLAWRGFQEYYRFAPERMAASENSPS